MVAGLKLQHRKAIELVPGRSVAMTKKLSPEAELDRKTQMAAAIKAHIEAAAAQQARNKAYAEEFQRVEASRKS